MNETDSAHHQSVSGFESPYVGLVPYEEKQAPLFFGRDTDCEVIIANLRAARLTLFYGPSGVGKSSVLRAGVIPRLRQRAQPADSVDAIPDFVVVYFKDWVNDPLAELAACVKNEIERALPRGLFESVPQSRDLAQTLAAWTERYGIELIILVDQFEEYFLYRPQEKGPGTFADEFPKAVNQRDLPVRFMLSLREDALSRLDRFKGSIPHLFDTRLQITHLREEGAREAIRGPVHAFRDLLKAERLVVVPDYDIEPKLVDEVLHQVNGLKHKLSGSGQGALKNDQAPLEIEAPYLQLVMTRIWQAEQNAGSPMLREQTLATLGGADKIVREHLDAVMDKLPSKDQAVAAAVFPYLVTPVGTKIAHAVKTMSNDDYTGLPKEQLEPVLSALARESRILRPVSIQTGHGEEEGYEIFHDALAPAILDWRTRYEAKQAAARARRRGYVLTGVIAMILLSIAAYLFKEYRSEAIIARQEANNAQQYSASVVDRERQVEEKKQQIEEIEHKAQQLKQILTEKEPRSKEVRSEVASLVQQIKQTELGSEKFYNPLPPPRVYIHIQSESQRPKAKEIQKQLVNADFIVPGIEKVDNRHPGRTELRYFRKEDQPKAEEAVKVLKQAGVDNIVLKYVSSSKNSTKIRPGHYELWFAADAFGVGTYSPVQQQAVPN